MITWEVRILLTCDNSERSQTHRSMSYKQYVGTNQNHAVNAAVLDGWTVGEVSAFCPECTKARAGK